MPISVKTPRASEFFSTRNRIDFLRRSRRRPCSAVASRSFRSRTRSDRLSPRSDRSWSIIISLTYLLMAEVMIPVWLWVHRRIESVKRAKPEPSRHYPETRMPGLMVAETVIERI